MLPRRFSIRNAKTLESLTNDLQKIAPLEVAFKGLQIVADGEEVLEKTKVKRIKRTWLGQVAMGSRCEEYDALRHTFADCAYRGDWEGLWKILAKADELYEENWVNAVRPSG